MTHVTISRRYSDFLRLPGAVGRILRFHRTEGRPGSGRVLVLWHFRLPRVLVWLMVLLAYSEFEAGFLYLGFSQKLWLYAGPLRHVFFKFASSNTHKKFQPLRS